MDIYCVWGWGRAESIHLWISETEYFWDDGDHPETGIEFYKSNLGHVNYEYCLCYLASCQTLVDELWTYKGALAEWGMIAVMLLAEIIYYWQKKRSLCIIWHFSKKKKKKVFQNDQRLRMEKVSNEVRLTQRVRNFHPEILVILVSHPNTLFFNSDNFFHSIFLVFIVLVESRVPQLTIICSGWGPWLVFYSITFELVHREALFLKWFYIY